MEIHGNTLLDPPVVIAGVPDVFQNQGQECPGLDLWVHTPPDSTFWKLKVYIPHREGAVHQYV